MNSKKIAEIKTNNHNSIAFKLKERQIAQSMNTIHRTILTLIMVPSFLLILSLNNAYAYVLIYLIKNFAYSEVVRILHTNRKNTTSTEVFLSWYFMMVADVYLLGQTLSKIYIRHIPAFFIEKHLFYCFSFYIAGFIFFVLKLQKKMLRTQFAHFAVTHITIFVVSSSCNLIIKNIVNGKCWLAFPALLVITNDVFSYIFGKLFGKRPLIKLSPKKTWEGFIGGLISTIFIGLLLCYIKIKYNVFSDKYDTYFYKNYELFGNVLIKRIYLHAFSFILFASLVAPFGGFFASGFKRAFKVKDFGVAIPGHGGIMDRMDCQFLMGVFTYVYYNSFILKRIITKKKILDLIVRNLGKAEISELISDLGNLI